MDAVFLGSAVKAEQVGERDAEAATMSQQSL
jgi:hypothetical protein